MVQKFFMRLVISSVCCCMAACAASGDAWLNKAIEWRIPRLMGIDSADTAHPLLASRYSREYLLDMAATLAREQVLNERAFGAVIKAFAEKKDDKAKSITAQLRAFLIAKQGGRSIPTFKDRLRVSFVDYMRDTVTPPGAADGGHSTADQLAVSSQLGTGGYDGTGRSVSAQAVSMPRSPASASATASSSTMVSTPIAPNSRAQTPAAMQTSNPSLYRSDGGYGAAGSQLLPPLSIDTIVGTGTQEEVSLLPCPCCGKKHFAGSEREAEVVQALGSTLWEKLTLKKASAATRTVAGIGVAVLAALIIEAIVRKKKSALAVLARATKKGLAGVWRWLCGQREPTLKAYTKQQLVTYEEAVSLARTLILAL